MTETASIRRLGRQSAKMVVFMAAFSLMSYVDRTAISIAGPEVMKEFDISATLMGTVYSAFILSYAILMLPGGWLVDRWGARLVLTIMGGGAAICTALTALIGEPALSLSIAVVPTLLGIRFLLGAFTAPLYPACARLTANWIPLQLHARVQGLIIGGAPLGSALTSSIFPWLIADHGWRASFYVAAIGTAVLALLWRRLSPDDVGQRSAAARTTGQIRENESPPWRRLLRNRNLALLAGGYFTLGYFEYIFFYWIYYYFGEVRGMARSESAVYTTLLLVSMTVAMPSAGWLSDRLIPRFGALVSRRIVAGGGMAASAICLYLGTSTTGTVAMVALLALALGLAAGAEGPFWAAVIDVERSHVGAASGILNAVGNVGGLLAPVLTPLIASRLGWSVSLYFASGLILTGAALWLLIRQDPEEDGGGEGVSTCLNDEGLSLHA